MHLKKYLKVGKNNILMLSVLSITATGIAVSATASMVNSITLLSNNVYTLLNNIAKNTHQIELINLLTKTDINSTIKLLHAVIIEIPESNNQSILISLDNVKDIISQIENELISIEKKIEYNKSIYILPSFRSYDCSLDLNRITTKIEILDRRSNFLFRILDLCKNNMKQL